MPIFDLFKLMVTDTLDSSSTELDDQRRFTGTRRLYGEAAFSRFQRAHICVIGIGGVGSWVAEALARSAVGKLTLVDLDMVAESNVNRQIHALEGIFGKAKTLAMAERIHAINPACRVTEIEDFVTNDNLDEILGEGFDCVVDAIDQVRVKTALIARCHSRRLPIVTAGGAGGQTDPSRIQIADLSRTIQDPLLAKVRAGLRKEYGFPRDIKKKFGIPAVFSTEPLRYPKPDGFDGSDGSCEASSRPSGLHCAGYGSSVCVTASFGFFAAAEALRQLAVAET